MDTPEEEVKPTISPPTRPEWFPDHLLDEWQNGHDRGWNNAHSDDPPIERPFRKNYDEPRHHCRAWALYVWDRYYRSIGVGQDQEG